jgi:hypothetical protein
MNELRTMFGELMARSVRAELRSVQAELREKYNWAVQLARDITSKLMLLQCRKFKNAANRFTYIRRRASGAAGSRARELVGRSVQDKRVIFDLEQMAAEQPEAYQSILRDFQSEANFERFIEHSEQINIARNKLAHTVPKIYSQPAEFRKLITEVKELDQDDPPLLRNAAEYLDKVLVICQGKSMSEVLASFP